MVIKLERNSNTHLVMKNAKSYAMWYFPPVFFQSSNADSQQRPLKDILPGQLFDVVFLEATSTQVNSTQELLPCCLPMELFFSGISRQSALLFMLSLPSISSNLKIVLSGSIKLTSRSLSVLAISCTAFRNPVCC